MFKYWEFLKKRKDGGEQSHVTAYFLVAIKPLFTIGLLNNKFVTLTHGRQEVR